jgi:hypothetical protein
MGWTSNDLRIEMMNNEAAKNAAEAIKNYIAENAAVYETVNMENLMADLTVEDNAVVLEDSYSMHGWNYMTFVPEICKMLAATASFKGDASYYHLLSVLERLDFNDDYHKQEFFELVKRAHQNQQINE